MKNVYIPGTLNNHVFNGCFSWMIPNLYMKKWLVYQTSIKHGCLEFQVHVKHMLHDAMVSLTWFLRAALD